MLSTRCRRPRHRAALATALALGALLLAGLAAPAVAASTPRRTTPAAPRSDAQALRALHAAQALFAAGAKPGRPGRDATVVLNELVRQRPALSPSDRRAADALLARPTDSGDPDQYTVPEETPVCGTDVCVHYVTSSADRVPDQDTAPANGIPDYVDKALATVEHVHRTYVAAGYRAPRQDGNRGGNGKTDVYLSDVGADNLYGYCSSDQRSTRHDLWAYCVFDNDYKAAQFPVHTPLQNLQVTAAHEYFHAVQFAYDFYEDRWFMEATATWAEDELYDAVDDNVNYLKYGQLGRPQASLDLFNKQGLDQYGNWIFFRYLTERFTDAQGGMPTLVRSMWRLADAAPTKPDLYSTAAIAKVLARKQTSLRDAYALFSARNRFSQSMYDEGAANNYPKAPIAKRATLSPSTTRTQPLSGTLNHLTSYAVAIRPSGTSGGWKLKVSVDMADAVHAPVVVVDRLDPAGTHHVARITLDASGKGTKTVGFDTADATTIVVTLVNAGARFKCRQRTNYSCHGRPLDNGSGFTIKAVAKH